jgi:antibiotic biosynthesis monooxygenase (ABM) superfamily enzyme
MTASPAAFDGPVTLLFRRKVKPGREAAYKAWVAGIQQASRAVKGFLDAGTMGHAAEENVYVSIVRFASFAELQAWEGSDLRRDWLATLPPDTVDGEAEIRRLDGLEFWFTAPGVATAAAPSPHKMVVVLVAVILGVGVLLSPVQSTLLASAPAAVRTVVMVTLQVTLMTYVIMPRVTRLLAGWLFRT